MMSNNAEYDSLVSQKNSTQRQYNACEDRIEDYDELLRRLRAAKDSVAELKDDFKDNKKLDKKMKKEKRKWKGSTNDKFISKMETLIEGNDDYYKKSLDKVHDSLNNEITRIENLRMEEKGLLGKLGATLNSLGNKIENFFN